MKERLPYDDIIRQRLEEYESEVPDNMFDRISQIRGEERTNNPDEIIKEKLTDYESAVPAFLFENMMNERDARTPSTEEVIRRKLIDHESIVPTNMFDRIVNEREGRRPVAVAWWQTSRLKWVMAALLLVLLIGGYKFIQNDIPKFLNTDNAHLSKSDNGDIPVQSTTLNDIKAPNTEGKSIIQPNNKIIEEANSTSKNISEKNIVEYKSIDKIFNRKSNVNNVTKAVITAEEVKKSASKITKITSNAQPTTFISPLSELPQPDKNSEHLPSKSEITISRNSKLFNPLLITSAKGIALAALSSEMVVKALPCRGPDYGCPTFQKKRSTNTTLYVDVYGAPEYAFRNLKTITSEYNEYRNARDTVEKSQYAFSAGAGASVLFGKGLILRGGIVYAQMHEKFQKDSLGIGNIRYIIDRNPNTGQLDTVEVQVTNGIFRKTRYNQYRSLDFTVRGGYEFALNDDLSIGINGGVNLNIQTGRKATVLAQDFQAIDVSKDNAIYQTSVGASIVGSLSAYWRLSYRWQLMVEPQFRHYLKPITKTDYVLRQNYTNAGLNIGLRYRLSK